MQGEKPGVLPCIVIHPNDISGLFGWLEPDRLTQTDICIDLVLRRMIGALKHWTWDTIEIRGEYEDPDGLTLARTASIVIGSGYDCAGLIHTVPRPLLATPLRTRPRRLLTEER
jgi:hypothetical protein